ncbi:MAG: hypothetical protein LBH44_07065 [Treponema sp.]|jgi:hypothetical protein|nr:hypothetical protein [Treponema sp.]
MKRTCVLFIFIFLTVFVFAQSRDDTRVFIPPIVGYGPDAGSQAAFFKENFEMETTAAGYSITDSAGNADYLLRLGVRPNLVLYDDGTEEQAPPEEKQFILQINLIRTEDDFEIISFAFPFTELDEMYEYNLYLLYEAMANVPLTKLAGTAPVDDRWRNKWLYLRASIDYPITFYALTMGDKPYLYKDAEGTHDPELYHLDNRISPWLAATLGFELQYLNWMSTELNFNLSFSDPMSDALLVSMQIEQKFPIKPSTHFMIEPYAALSFTTNTSTDVIEFPQFGIGGGVQFGVKGGSMGAFFVDVNYIHFLSDVKMKNTNEHYDKPKEITYTRFVLGLGIGYKIGFFDRRKNEIP